MLDLEPATSTLTALVLGVRDDQLDAPTPCGEITLAGLIDHIEGLCLGFTAAATKDLETGSQAPHADASHLADNWRTVIRERLVVLAEVWRDEAAWSGMTRVGGVDLPAEVAGMFAVDEVLVHGWDIAVSSGQEFSYDPQLAQPVHDFLKISTANAPDGTPGLFRPPVPVADDAPLMDRVLGLTGRSPSWRPTIAHV